MKDLTKIYIDLSKCTEEQRNKIEKVTGFSLIANDYPYLIWLNGRWDQGVRYHIKNRTELTYPDFIKLFEGGEGENNGWIKIESEADLPKETCTVHVYPNYLERDIFFFYDDELSRDELMENHTHYQPIIKPEPPKF